MLLLSAPTLRIYERKKHLRVLDIFLLREKTFRVACNTLNEIFCFWGGHRKGNARGLIRFVHGTDRRPGLEFLLRFESTIYEEREAFENTNTPCIIACLCKRSARCFVFVRRREDSVVIGDDDDAGGRCAPSHKRRRIVTESTRAHTRFENSTLSSLFSSQRLAI